VRSDRQTLLIVGLGVIGGGAVALSLGLFLAMMFDARDGMSYRLPSASMAPTLLEGDYITSRQFAAAGNSQLVHRGDLVVHEFPSDPTKRMVKRVIGLPGDTLAMTSGVVMINGHALREAYAQHTDSMDPAVDDFRWQRVYLIGDARRDSVHYIPSRDNWGPLLVPERQFFVLGDNRTSSLDSRWFGFVSAGEVVGRVRRIYFSRDDRTGHIRWSRIGRLVQ